MVIEGGCGTLLNRRHCVMVARHMYCVNAGLSIAVITKGDFVHSLGSGPRAFGYGVVVEAAESEWLVRLTFHRHTRRD